MTKINELHIVPKDSKIFSPTPGESVVELIALSEEYEGNVSHIMFRATRHHTSKAAQETMSILFTKGEFAEVILNALDVLGVAGQSDLAEKIRIFH